MKAKDITVGQTYAVGRPGYTDPATVLEVGPIERVVFVNGRSRSACSPAVRVCYEPGGYGAKVGSERVLPLTKVLHPWDEELRLREARRQNEQ